MCINYSNNKWEVDNGIIHFEYGYSGNIIGKELGGNAKVMLD